MYQIRQFKIVLQFKELSCFATLDIEKDIINKVSNNKESVRIIASWIKIQINKKEVDINSSILYKCTSILNQY